MLVVWVPDRGVRADTPAEHLGHPCPVTAATLYWTNCCPVRDPGAPCSNLRHFSGIADTPHRAPEQSPAIAATVSASFPPATATAQGHLEMLRSGVIGATDRGPGCLQGGHHQPLWA